MRKQDWPERLMEVFAGFDADPFAYGQADCALGAATAADAITGSAIAATYRGQYATLEAGMALLKSRTGKDTLQDWADGLWPRTPCALARRGDWALVHMPADDDGEVRAILLVVDGAWLRGPGAMLLRRGRAELCWSVD